jgi:hypothetical protein
LDRRRLDRNGLAGFVRKGVLAWQIITI